MWLSCSTQVCENDLNGTVESKTGLFEGPAYLIRSASYIMLCHLGIILKTNPSKNEISVIFFIPCLGPIHFHCNPFLRYKLPFPDSNVI